MRIGIDVGGTNTDAVLMDGERVVVSVKTSTAEDVTSGIVAALDGLRQRHAFEPADVRAVMIGTTHFINALIERRRLAPTAVIRLGLPATAALPPMVGWPEDLVEAIEGRAYMCHGGHEFDGRKISDLDVDELKRVASDMAAHGISSVAITSVFSPVTSEFELRAAEVIQAELGEVDVSLSHEIGRMGLLERENATVINASLRSLARHIVSGLAEAVRGHGIAAPLYLSQNDGTLMDLDFALRYPVVTFASGPTNSMRGAAMLSGLGDCAVVDIGGTTSDVGIVRGGFPREAGTDVTVAGIRTNFRMPDVVSIGIGGGSLVRFEGAEAQVGPKSVGFRLPQRAMVFGGGTLTATDVAVAAGRAKIGDPSLVAHLDRDLVSAALDVIVRRVVASVERMRTSPEPLPVVAVGGGSILLPDQLEGVEVHRPENYSVANAVGAAIAQVGGEVDRVYSIEAGGRARALDEARQEAVDRAIKAGASPGTVEVVEVEEVPLAYLPGNATRIQVKAVGALQIS
ncbi:hydantoinase subunit beta [Streptomyces sp. MUSC 125]|uniref:hydantoinase/oxoprolinase N-terminal domain-containing protein n=1 Tax=unclassified Streptomyces TaxID=2593676 RepID=UPI00057D1C8A|nr:MULTISPECIES: hydantoinase/oxoprolinase family protein [unclassified Streptomyces]KIE25365.1 hydantoinase subunit beta [Streptomyces sp. MUSC 125]MCH0561297.1 hydantoinase/oxoprolinase family protein [Streptomyces sp. MUM 16J]